MAIQEFAECYAERVGTTVDAVIDDLVRLGDESIRAFLRWWKGLGEKTQNLVKKVAGIAVDVLKKILTRAVGEAAAVALIGLLGGAAWALLVISFIDCESRL